MENEYIKAITERYEPALSVDEATHFLTTEDICRAIAALNPGASISAADVYEMMKAAGFLFRLAPGTVGMQFRWIMRER